MGVAAIVLAFNEGQRQEVGLLFHGKGERFVLVFLSGRGRKAALTIGGLLLLVGWIDDWMFKAHSQCGPDAVCVTLVSFGAWDWM